MFICYYFRCYRSHTPYVAAVYELSHLIVKRAMYVHNSRGKFSLYVFLSYRFFPAYYDWIYALMPDSWRFNKLCNLVHKFSMDIIKKRRKELKNKKVQCVTCSAYSCVLIILLPCKLPDGEM